MNKNVVKDHYDRHANKHASTAEVGAGAGNEANLLAASVGTKPGPCVACRPSSNVLRARQSR
jgi:hypothetical protein